MADKLYQPLYQCWHENDFLADRAVSRMAPLQRHFYRSLLQAAFHISTRPYLPADDVALCELADADNLEQWLANKGPVLAKFSAFEAEDGTLLFSQKRVTNDWNQMMEYVEKKSKAGKARHGKSAPAQHPAARALKPKQKTETESLKKNGKETITETEPASASVFGSAINTVAVGDSDSVSSVPAKKKLVFSEDDTEMYGAVSVSLSKTWTVLFGSEGQAADFSKIITLHYAGDELKGQEEIPDLLSWAATKSNHWTPEKLGSSRALLNAFAEVRRQWTVYMDKVRAGAVEKAKKEKFVDWRSQRTNERRDSHLADTYTDATGADATDDDWDIDIDIGIDIDIDIDRLDD